MGSRTATCLHTAGAIGLALALGHAPRAAGQEAPTSKRLTVLAQTRTSTCYVGQTVDVYVGVVAGRESPRVSAPDVPWASLTYAGTRLRPLAVGGIGATVVERNLYRSRYRLVPRRAGTRTVPPFVARLGDRQGASEPLRLTTKDTPVSGRPAEFLGGVGAFDVEATAEPTSVRSGQTIEYRVTITGDAARGITARPDLSRIGTLAPGFRVEPRGERATDEPPSHTFVYALRPARAGEATLPPVRVAAFDPETRRYQTRATAGIPVRVAEVPRFDPSALNYRPPAASRPRPRLTRRGAVAGSAVALALASLTLATASAWRGGRPARAVRRLCREVVSRLDRAPTDAARARVLGDGLAEYLGLMLGRPPGALTPDDARAGVARATGSDDLARRVAWLLARCDEARFDPGSSLPPDLLLGAGWLLFEDLSGAPRARNRFGPAIEPDDPGDRLNP